MYQLKFAHSNQAINVYSDDIISQAQALATGTNQVIEIIDNEFTKRDAELLESNGFIKQENGGDITERDANVRRHYIRLRMHNAEHSKHRA